MIIALITVCTSCEVNEELEMCPEISFESERDGDTNGYNFFPTAFDGIEDVGLSWSIDGDFVAVTSGADTPFYYQFAPGSYEVCLFVETPACPEGTSFCRIIEIEEETCPELFFEAERDGDLNAYYFYPRAFEGIDNVVLEWTVDDEFVGRTDGDNTPFYYQFESGRHKVCLQVETPTCPDGISYCTIMVVN